jgi:hypothetical protein
MTNVKIGRRRTWGAAFAGLGLLVLAWALWPRDAAPDQVGTVQIAAPSVPERGGEAPRPAATRAPVSAQRNSELADENRYLVTHEAPDSGWAKRSKAEILNFVQGLAYVDRRALEVQCGSSVCEVSGLALEDPASGAMAPTWEAMERDTAGDTLAAKGLERTATTFGTGRVREAFSVYYRRTDSASGR